MGLLFVSSATATALLIGCALVVIGAVIVLVQTIRGAYKERDVRDS